MKFFDAALLRLRLALLAGALVVLAGCASTGPATPVKPQTEAAVPVTVAPQRATGPMQPLAAAEASSRAVALLRPPADLWERIRRGYAMPNLDTELVRDREQWYAARPEYMQRMANRSSKYLFHIVEELERRNMPTELALLPFIESAFNPQAVSSAKAAGMWQFMPATGKDFELKQNAFRDDRRDVLESTRAALDYLQKLYGMFGDWQLALAAYNWGEGSVGRAIARNKAAGLPTGYTDLNMPNETRYYVPKLQAVKNIVRDPEKYGLVLADIPDAPFFTVVKTTRKIDTKRAAEIAEMSFDDFVALNPQHNRPVIAGADEQSILLPIDNAEIFAAKLELTDQPLVSWQAYRLKANENLGHVATRYGMSEQTLRAVNGIGSRARVPAGHMLLVPAERPSQETVEALDQAVFTTVPSGRTFYYTVRRGDTLQGVAGRYGVTVQEVKSWNSLNRDSLQAGQKLRVTSDVVPVARAGGSSKRAVATKGASKQATGKRAPAKSAATPKTSGKAAKGHSRGTPTARANGQPGG